MAMTSSVDKPQVPRGKTKDVKQESEVDITEHPMSSERPGPCQSVSRDTGPSMNIERGWPESKKRNHSLGTDDHQVYSNDGTHLLSSDRSHALSTDRGSCRNNDSWDLPASSGRCQLLNAGEGQTSSHGGHLVSSSTGHPAGSDQGHFISSDTGHSISIDQDHLMNGNRYHLVSSDKGSSTQSGKCYFMNSNRNQSISTDMDRVQHIKHDRCHSKISDTSHTVSRDAYMSFVTASCVSRDLRNSISSDRGHPMSNERYQSMNCDRGSRSSGNSHSVISGTSHSVSTDRGHSLSNGNSPVGASSASTRSYSAISEGFNTSSVGTNSCLLSSGEEASQALSLSQSQRKPNEFVMAAQLNSSLDLVFNRDSWQQDHSLLQSVSSAAPQRQQEDMAASYRQSDGTVLLGQEATGVAYTPTAQTDAASEETTQAQRTGKLDTVLPVQSQGQTPPCLTRHKLDQLKPASSSSPYRNCENVKHLELWSKSDGSSHKTSMQTNCNQETAMDGRHASKRGFIEWKQTHQKYFRGAASVVENMDMPRWHPAHSQRQASPRFACQTQRAGSPGHSQPLQGTTRKLPVAPITPTIYRPLKTAMAVHQKQAYDQHTCTTKVFAAQEKNSNSES